MIVEIGHFALVLALAVALVQMALPAWGAQARDGRLMQIAEPAAFAQLGLIALAFAALTYGYVTSDFSVATVAANSHVDKPLIYKIAGAWGNHEGSMLLWCSVSAVFGAILASARGGQSQSLWSRAACERAGLVTAGAARLHRSSLQPIRAPRSLAPMPRRAQSAAAGSPRSPHPPLLFGYVGFSACRFPLWRWRR